MASEFPERSSQAHSLTHSASTTDDALQRIYDELARDEYDPDECRRSAERSRQAYEASRRRLNEMVALAGGKVSAPSTPSNTAQGPMAPAVAADRTGGAVVREESSTSTPSIPFPVSPLSPTTATLSPVPTLSPISNADIIAHGRASYPIARNVTENPVARPVAWRRLSEAEQEAIIDQLLEDRGATAFTLHIPADVEADIVHAARGGRKLVQVIADRMIRQFRRHGLDVPAFRFTVEKVSSLHLHGVMLFDVPLAGRKRDAVRDCLKHSLGRWRGPDGGGQLQFKDYFNARSRWRRYSSKDHDRLAEALGTDELSYTSRQLLQVARDSHEERRKSRSGIAYPAEILVPSADQAIEDVPADDGHALTHSDSLTSTGINPLGDSRPTPDARQRPPVSHSEAPASHPSAGSILEDHSEDKSVVTGQEHKQRPGSTFSLDSNDELNHHDPATSSRGLP